MKNGKPYDMLSLGSRLNAHLVYRKIEGCKKDYYYRKQQTTGTQWRKKRGRKMRELRKKRERWGRIGGWLTGVTG